MTKINVEIFGEEFTIRGEADSEYILSIANHVDATMHEVAATLKDQNPKKIAILAALNIADELMQKNLNSPDEKDVEAVEEKTRKLISMIDDGLIGDFY